MRDAIRHFSAEFIGTFALVFVGGAALVHADRGSAGLVQAALANGLILFVLVTATMRISGHFNPAVTLGFLVARRIEAVMAGVYIVAQLLASMVAAYAIKWLLPADAALSARLGGQAIALDVTGTQAIVLEAIATFFLAFVIFGTAVDPKAPRVGGLAIGLTMTAGILAIGPYTGGSLNPARALGPAVAMGDFTAQAVYWVGPIVGAIAASLLYEHLFLRHGIEPVDHGAVRPVA
ncbi:MAG TPA: aquaporin [Gemmatimonadaceae bacterium]|nr:aquaporin [Gemmatimonadaceae bacterium]